MASPAEQSAMRRALELAADPSAPAGPNPRVGAVILDREGAVVGEGFHRGAGSDHAEVAALRASGARARGGTAVVSLEPCHHQGRTGPCSRALLTAGVERVVYAQSESGRRATGGGSWLRAAGLQVESGVLEQEAAALNPIYTRARELGRPFVTYKFAATLDGRVAAADGTSRWITGRPARADAHRLRAEVDAILVGTGTALADDPALTVRGVESCRHRPLRVVMGLRDLPTAAAVFDEEAPTRQLRTRDPHEVLAVLTDDDVDHLLVEGGPTVAASFVEHGLVDRVVVYVAPVLLGSGPTALSDAGIGTLSEALRLTEPEVKRVGDDVRIVGLVQNHGDSYKTQREGA